MIQANRAHVKKEGKWRNWPRFLFLGIGFYLVWTLSKGIWELKLAYKRIDEARRVLAMEQAKAQTLQEKWSQVQTSAYLEEVARNDLNMQREGETVVVLSREARSSSAGSDGEPNLVEERELPNYLKWWNLLR